MFHIKMVIGQFRPINGGAERQAELLAKTLIGKGIHVEVYTIRPRGVPARLPDDTVPVQRLWAPGYRSLKQMMIIGTLYYKLMAQKGKTDLIHIHQGLAPAFAGVRAAQRLGVPSIVKCGNSGPRFDLAMLEQGHLFGHRMATYVAQHTTRFAALNDQIETQLQAWGVEAERIIPIPNGVTVGEAVTLVEKTESRKRLGLDPEAFVALSVGNLNPKKDYTTLLKAFQQCRKTMDATLLIVGVGPQRAQLEREAQDLGIASAVHFTGAIPPDQVREYLNAADVFLLSSITEGLSNALLEAMAAGLPAIVSDIPANRLLIEDGHSGILFPAGQVNALAQSIESIHKNLESRRRLGSNARQKVCSNFSIESVADRYIQLYEKLLEKTKS